MDADSGVGIVVIGAGQAGLSAAYHLRRLGLDFVVLDADDAPGGAWRHRAPSLGVTDLHRIFDLPGMPFEPPASGRAATVVPSYFARYEQRFALPVRRPVRVHAVRRGHPGFVLDTDDGVWRARAVINATGTWTRPYIPVYPGAADFAGRQLHYAAYRGPDDFAGLRVIVVGGGNSAVHVLSELAGVAASTRWVTRRPPVFHDGEFTEDHGRAVIARVTERVTAGLPPRSVVSVTGLGYTSLVRAALAKGALDRRPMFDRLVPAGAVWDGTVEPADAIIWATGFRAALTHLAPLRLREPGGGIRLDGTATVREPLVHLIGYGPSASTVGANRAGRAAALALSRALTAGTTGDVTAGAAQPAAVPR
ncbi:NAD(P)/FAD-dependent oxidoreductase [Dactylosporangium aurantiacum]|uniref:NAD(P)/FAD-dependent oxidoreductase n=1 Tax=Dactylosporangium aurantiacum TaxID=35754 RepID=A0A9Q9IF80_9ACTN|nr:FAD-dependent oxidoreductase [Dactylosporangium aurantiacum]MDG6103376.1 FAD-dependent oxidoreductase [Dactylosporangium aurantiacum]UWZ52108.1 NAD(P)/FAD-dependent oxidoreductase [Dactylosporangium aurantiacum]